MQDAVELCARIIPIFESGDIPVIRLGLNPTDELSGGAAIAGAITPPRELVYSGIYFEKACAVLAGAPPGSSVVLAVGKGRTSLATGRRKGNISALEARFGLRSVKITETEGVGREIILKSIENY